WPRCWFGAVIHPCVARPRAVNTGIPQRATPHAASASRHSSRRRRMADDLAPANANRASSLAATSIAIFTFALIFLYPRFRGGEVDALSFQATLIVMGVATFSFVLSSLNYYCAFARDGIDAAERALHSRRADRFWLLGYTLMFLAPSLILFSVKLSLVAWVGFALWVLSLLFVIRNFPGIQTKAVEVGTSSPPAQREAGR